MVRPYANMGDYLRANSKVDANGCWVWQLSQAGKGYGQVGSNEPGGTKGRYAHRASYAFFNGPIPKGLQVQHTCHNRACCNPAHLKLGTGKQNMLDRTLAGRKGWKITPADVRRIRADGRAPLSVIAADYGITPSVVSKIKLRQLWRDVVDRSEE